MKEYMIRYNTKSENDETAWRVLEDGQEFLVRAVHINVPCYTSKDFIEEHGVKFHIKCKGNLKITDNEAYISE